MSSRVTPSSRSTTTRTTLRRPAGGTTSSSRSYPAAPTPGSTQPASRVVAGSGRRSPRNADTGSPPPTARTSSVERRTAHDDPPARAVRVQVGPGNGGKGAGYPPPPSPGAARGAPPPGPPPPGG